MLRARLPKDLYGWAKGEAKRNRRSLTQQIIVWLEQARQSSMGGVQTQE